MPYYLFSNPENPEETEEVFFSMNDEKKHFKDGVEWKRVFTKPNAAVQTNFDPHSSESFIKYTDNKKGTYGDLLDISAEASAARAEKNGGVDPVKEKYYEDYSKRNNGAVHLEKKKEDARKRLNKMGINVEF